MNDDLISRSAVLDVLKTEEGAAILGNSFVRFVKAKTLIEKIPSVDAVEVCRCKDCKHGEIDDPDFPYQLYCHMGHMWNDAYHFCADGERRADDEDLQTQ